MNIINKTSKLTDVINALLEGKEVRLVSWDINEFVRYDKENGIVSASKKGSSWLNDEPLGKLLNDEVEKDRTWEIKKNPILKDAPFGTQFSFERDVLSLSNPPVYIKCYLGTNGGLYGIKDFNTIPLNDSLLNEPIIVSK